jgi:hypothetical protein
MGVVAAIVFFWPNRPNPAITHLRIKPLALTNGHGRYIIVTPERTLVSVGEWPLRITVINL